MGHIQHYDVAIVGAGFCGTVTAVNLARLSPGIKIALIEKTSDFGPGLAYGTSDPDHLLNARAGMMSAMADDPLHFWRFLETQPEIKATLNASAQSFVPRFLLGRYLKALLAESRKAHPQLEQLTHHIVNIKCPPKGGFELVSKDGQTMTADCVVLAIGNFLPDQLSVDVNAMTPYAPSTWRKLAEDGDILIIGTGLTSLDLITTLSKTKRNGTIHLLSRHGLLPQEHVNPTPYTLAHFKPPYPTTARGLCRALRKEIASAPTTPWQNVVDALRPLNQMLWQSMSLDEQRRFLRHLRIYWETHRHRCPPQVMDNYRALEKTGRLKLHRGTIVTQTPTESGTNIIWRPRGKSSLENFQVRHVVRCTGPKEDFSKIDDVLIQNLIAQNLISTDALRLGVASVQKYAVCNNHGEKTNGLYTLGSLIKGQLYETFAIPELRAQAAELAQLIVQETRQTL